MISSIVDFLAAFAMFTAVALGLWAMFGDEPQWLDDITDPVATAFAE